MTGFLPIGAWGVAQMETYMPVVAFSAAAGASSSSSNQAQLAAKKTRKENPFKQNNSHKPCMEYVSSLERLIYKLCSL